MRPIRRVRAYTVKGAALRVDVSIWTIRDWIKRGQLTAIPNLRGPKGQRYYSEFDLVEVERANRRGRTRRREPVV